MEFSHPFGSPAKHGKQLAVALVSVLMLALFGGCKQSTKPVHAVDGQAREEQGTAAVVQQEQALTFERIAMEESRGGLNYGVSLLLPEANTPAAKAIRSELVQMFYDTSSELKPKSGESILDFARRQQQAMIADIPEIDDGAEWAWDFTIDTMMQTKRYINFTVNSYVYLGGAHGSSFGGGTTFRLSDGKRITEFFKDPDDPDLHPFLIEGLCQYFNKYGDDNVTPDNLGYYLMDDPSTLQLPASAPCLTGEGVVITYSEYEIAPYAAGAPSFVIPYEKVMSYLTEEVLELIRQ